MEDWVWVLIPLAPFGIAMIAILNSHQQKMAQIVHGSQRQAVNADELAALRQEVQSMRDQLHKQALELDDLRTSLPSRMSASSVELKS